MCADPPIPHHSSQIHKMWHSFVHSFIPSFLHLNIYCAFCVRPLLVLGPELLSSGGSFSRVNTIFLACHFCFSLGLMRMSAFLLSPHLIKMFPCHSSCQALPERTVPAATAVLHLGCPLTFRTSELPVAGDFTNGRENGLS